MKLRWIALLILCATAPARRNTAPVAGSASVHPAGSSLGLIRLRAPDVSDFFLAFSALTQHPVTRLKQK
jgi:hypothetical protein